MVNVLAAGDLSVGHKYTCHTGSRKELSLECTHSNIRSWESSSVNPEMCVLFWESGWSTALTNGNTLNLEGNKSHTESSPWGCEHLSLWRNSSSLRASMGINVCVEEEIKQPQENNGTAGSTLSCSKRQTRLGSGSSCKKALGRRNKYFLPKGLE